MGLCLYILNERGEPVAEPDIEAYCEWFGRTDRCVGRDVVHGFLVSTVFLGIDHDWTGRGPPVLWETMVFGPGDPTVEGVEGFQVRCSGSREQALAQHDRVVLWVEMETKSLTTRARFRAAPGGIPPYLPPGSGN